MTVARKLVVTGASSGVGRAVALCSAQAGWNVLATVRKEAQRQQLEAAGCDTAILELRDVDSIESFAKQAASWCQGKLEALVNNAGVALPGPVEELHLEDVREQFEVNVFGHIHVSQRLLPALREAHGRIIFVSSDRAQLSIPIYGAYVASKRALSGFAEALAAEVRSFSVAVTILELGSFESNIRTEIRARLESAEHNGSLYAELVRAAESNLGKPPMGTPDEAASAVLDLLQCEHPPLVSTFPTTSQVKVIRSQLNELGEKIERLLGQIEQEADESQQASKES